MNEDAKAASDRIWNGLKTEVEAMAVKITAFYEASGSTRHCRHINELWHPENAAVGIGFVPPEALARLEAFVERAGIHLHKGNGPLGKGVYFSLLYDDRLTVERLHQLGDMVEQETRKLKDAPPPTPKPTPAPEYTGDPQVARMEGLTAIRGDKLRSRPTEVAGIVEAFNGATMDMTPEQALKLLATAIPYFEHLPDIARHQLLHTLDMMEDAEKKS